MQKTQRAVAVLLLAAVFPLSGAETDSARAVAFARATRGDGQQQRHAWCATSDTTTARQTALARWAEAKARVKARGRNEAFSFGGPVRFENNMFIMTTDNLVLPGDRPVDLQNSSLYFTRAGTSYDVQKTALVYEDDVTAWVDLNAPSYAPRSLPFNFPFGGASYNTVYVSSTKGLFFSAPPAANMEQYDLIEAVLQRVPAIAPLLETTQTNWWSGTVYVREVAGVSITFNWRQEWSDYAHDIQATLFANGDIRFSYKTIGKLVWGTVLVTSGTEPFYSARTAVMSASDPVGDVHANVPVSLRPMIDIQGMAIQRISSSDLLELQVTLGATFNAASLAPGSELYFYFEIGATPEERSDNYIYAIVNSSGDVNFHYPGGSWSTNPAAVTFSGNTVKVVIPEDALALGTLQSAMYVATWYSAAGYTGDWALADFTFNIAGSAAATDLSSLSAPRRLSGPIVEPFTLPELNTDAVWQRLKAAYGLTDDDIDQVAIYQSFYTDIVFYAGAYSTVGNSGDDGVHWNRSGSTYPRQPAMLHMNTLGYGWNSEANGILAVRTHEFGHRWLYFLRILETGVPTTSLNPDEAHPKQGAHMPAAFSTITANDSSAMGGGYFTQVGPLSYQTAPTSTYYGFTWHELYLMGLAASGEVPGWYYLKGPGLEGPYYPFSNHTYNVTSRTDVTQQQLIDAMGARSPSYATSRKAFKEAVVLLERAGDPIPPASLPTYSSQLVSPFQTHFAAITNNRGSVVTVAPPLHQPANLSATATSATAVNVSWTAVAGATSYQVWRSSLNGAFALVGTPVSNSFNDAVSASTTYLYKVRTVYPAGVSELSAIDLATTVIFTDMPLSAGTTRVKGLHVTQLRTAVNAVRAAAGLAAVTFTDPSLAASAIGARHVIELRNAVNVALSTLGAPPITGTGTVVGGGSIPVRALDLQKIRDAIR